MTCLEALVIVTFIAEATGKVRIIVADHVGLLRKNKLPAELVKPLDEIYERLDQIIQDMRSLTSDLGCPTLYELGLGAAVRE